MIPQTPGKIFLAAERGLTESDRFRRYSTFNFGPWAHAHKGPFGRLYGLNEETLAGNHTLHFTVAEASHVLIMPLAGAVELGCAGMPATTIGVEETLLLTLPAGSVLQVGNPFATELVGFLHIWLLADAPVSAVTAQQAPFRFADSPSALMPLFLAAPGRPLAASIGQFAGRREAIYRPSSPAASVYAFVLAGAFEVEGRLMHEKDGLALWDTAEFELEALSNDAVVLVLELLPSAT
ncbi:pirin family protein [Hymenobacter daeguensis]